MVSDQPDIALGVLAADCAPVLLADAETGVVGAAHAGWRGALGEGGHGVLEATVEAMGALGAQNIAAAIGPCITQANYEVGADFEARFLAGDPEAADFFQPGKSPEKRQFDLPGFAARRLARAGVARIDRLDACTYAQETTFFSYRRSTHRGEPDYGRNLSVIALRAA